jgi:phosphoglycolate phosphatase
MESPHPDHRPSSSPGALAAVPTTYSHVLVDLDGTLTDSAPGILASLRHAFDAEGLDLPTVEVLLTAIGPPFELGLPLIGVPADRVVAVVEHYRGRYETVGLFENGLYEGVVEMLDALAATGVVLGLATAKPEPSARRIIDHFGLADRFAVVAGATYEPGRRTKAEVIAHALGELDVRPGRHVVMVGDRDHDVLAARELGLVSIAAGWGYGSREELTTAGVDVVAEQPADVVEIVRCG